MIVPTTLFQLAAVLLLAVPGIVYTAVRRWLGGPTPEDQALSVRLTRAVGVSVILDLTYLLVAGPALVGLVTGGAKTQRWTGVIEHPRLVAGVGLVLLVLIPAGLAGMAHLRLRRPRWRPTADDAPVPSALSAWWQNTARPALMCWSPVRLLPRAHPEPTAWDRAARDRGGAFVRIYTEDGHWVGGFLGEGSYISTYPQPRDVFIAQEWRLTSTGRFIEPVANSLGVYVPLTGKERVTWIEP